MENNDLPDFDAEDLLAAMAEELRKDEASGPDQAGADVAPDGDHQETGCADEDWKAHSSQGLADDPLSEITG